MSRITHADIRAERVTRGPLSGAWRLTAPDGRSKDYLYYTKREARQLFHAYVNGGQR